MAKTRTPTYAAFINGECIGVNKEALKLVDVIKENMYTHDELETYVITELKPVAAFEGPHAEDEMMRQISHE